MDVKKLGRIPDGRAGGCTAAPPAQPAATEQQDRLRQRALLLDDDSPVVYSGVLTDEKGTTCAGFLARAAAYFADHGIPTIERLMTDDAWAYKHSPRGVCTQLSIRQKFIRRHCPC